MNKTKSILILLSTLVLGLVLGFLISGQITKQKLDEFKQWGSEDGFKQIMLEAIKPEQGQMEKLEPIIEKHAKLNGELHNQWKKQHGELMRDLTKELENVLTAEQIAKWKGHGGSKK